MQIKCEARAEWDKKLLLLPLGSDLGLNARPYLAKRHFTPHQCALCSLTKNRHPQRMKNKLFAFYLIKLCTQKLRDGSLCTSSHFKYSNASCTVLLFHSHRTSTLPLLTFFTTLQLFFPGRVPEKWNAMHNRANDNRITWARSSHATLW